MKLSARFLCALAIGAFLSTAMIEAPALAQDKGKETKAAPAKDEKGSAKITPLLENDKVKVYESLYRPGDENKAVATSAYRVLHVVKGGTITRTFADGKVEKAEWKTGETKFLEPFKTSYVSRNNGKSDIQFYVVQLK
jgi:hypothetical protein